MLGFSQPHIPGVCLMRGILWPHCMPVFASGIPGCHQVARLDADKAAGSSIMCCVLAWEMMPCFVSAPVTDLPGCEPRDSSTERPLVSLGFVQLNQHFHCSVVSWWSFQPGLVTELWPQESPCTAPVPLVSSPECPHSGLSEGWRSPLCYEELNAMSSPAPASRKGPTSCNCVLSMSIFSVWGNEQLPAPNKESE